MLLEAVEVLFGVADNWLDFYDLMSDDSVVFVDVHEHVATLDAVEGAGGGDGAVGVAGGVTCRFNRALLILLHRSRISRSLHHEV